MQLFKTRGFKVSIVFFLMLAAVPLITKEPYLLHIGILSMMYACFTSSWNLVSGFTGIFGLGFQALAGLSGYTSSLLGIHLGMSPWFSIFFGAFMAMSVGAIFSVPSLKLRLMPYIAISSMCLGEVVRIIISNWVSLTRGELGLWGMKDFTDIGPISFAGGNRISYWYLILFFLIIFIFVIDKIVKAPLGRALNTIRDSQAAAESLGVNVAQTKIKIYMISSFMMGLIGGYYAHYIQILTPMSALGTTMMITIVAQVLLGGIGTIAGPIIGAFILTTLTETLRILGDYRLIAYGILIIITVIFLRKGIWGTFKPYVTKALDNRKMKKLEKNSAKKIV